MGKLHAGFKTSDSEQRETGNRRPDGRGTPWIPEGALAHNPGTTAGWELQAATGEAGGNPKTGRGDAQVGHSDGAGSVDPAGGIASSATTVEPNFLRTQLRLPAVSVGAAGSGSGTAVCS